MTTNILHQNKTERNTQLETLYLEERDGDPNTVRFVYDDVHGWRDVWHERQTDEQHVRWMVDIGAVYPEPVVFDQCDCTPIHTCAACKEYARTHFQETI